MALGDVITPSVFANTLAPGGGSQHSAILRGLDGRLNPHSRLKLPMPFSPKSTASESGALAGITFHDPVVAHANLERLSINLSPALASALPALLSEAPDPDSALLLLDRMATESPQTI